MARGGYGSGSGIPLQDRVRGGSRPASPPESGAQAAPQAGPTAGEPGASPSRHCWVTVPVDGPVPRPGLLLEWRAAGHGRWEGRVVYLAQLRPERWSLVEEWVAAELLTPP